MDNLIPVPDIKDVMVMLRFIFKFMFMFLFLFLFLFVFLIFFLFLIMYRYMKMDTCTETGTEHAHGRHFNLISDEIPESTLFSPLSENLTSGSGQYSSSRISDVS